MAVPNVKTISVTNAEFGERVTLVDPVNLYGCTLGDDVFVGPFVEIQKGVKVGNRTRIQSHAFVCEMVEIGEDCFISHGAKFVNDLFSNGGPARGNKALWMPTILGNRVSVGTNATVLAVSICNDVVIGAGSVVTRNITEPGIYAGNPARKIRDIHD
ncbi:N-acetyltransferase [Candidimonas sp. SYP-B2681]|uniref:acyltransferase n=1 Tax=Candidimonas sp. SYP-B2681 TaxID=2497686 RepID=UPI000F88835F|nr:acyltransferase [Candidimonas sp. SYP-B2681]RTZ42374.1 N-acetyltransferase [Candidimonas sp. SYP-B2681]